MGRHTVCIKECKVYSPLQQMFFVLFLVSSRKNGVSEALLEA
jgi:hypothetical protein